METLSIVLLSAGILFFLISLYFFYKYFTSKKSATANIEMTVKSNDEPATEANNPSETDDDAITTEGEDTPPPGEDTPPQGEDTPPPGEDTPPPGEDTPPQGEDTPPPSPQGKDTPSPPPSSQGEDEDLDNILRGLDLNLEE